MPVINFDGADKVILNGVDGDKAYIGNELVWEKSQIKIYTSHLTQEVKPSDDRIVFARQGQRDINVNDIVKVVIGGVTIPREKISSVDEFGGQRIHLTSSLGSVLGFDKTFYVFEPIEIHLK